jgi:hypothetical protein
VSGLTNIGTLQLAVDGAVAYAHVAGAHEAEAIELVCDYYRLESRVDRAVVARMVNRRLRNDAARGVSEAVQR